MQWVSQESKLVQITGPMTPIIWLLVSLLGNFQGDCRLSLSRNFYYKKRFTLVWIYCWIYIPRNFVTYVLFSFELKEFQCNRTGQKKELLILKGTTLVRLHLHPVTGLIISCLPLQLGDFQGALHVACRWLRILCFIGTREAGFKLNLKIFKLHLKL
jgi:hypothetical protein